METCKLILKLISWLLQYPDKQLLASLPDLQATVESIPDSCIRDSLIQFMAFLKSTPLQTLQEQFTSAFDLNPSTCLNLTYHRFGDGEKRAKALSSLHQMYIAEGYEGATGELPDYLPLLLEFCAVSSTDAGLSVLKSYCPDIRKLSAQIENTAVRYAGLMKILLSDFLTANDDGI